jgi:hypothetical protein
MSNPKITPKNLSYDATLPPFLQRLHNTSTSSSASLDGRHERAIARPKRPRDLDADKEDEPVFVDEETGEVVSAEEIKVLGARGEMGGDRAGLAGIEEERADRDENEVMGKEKEKEKEKQSAMIGVARKRKAVKVVGGDGSDGDTKAALTAGKENKKGQAKDGKPIDRKAKVVEGKAKARSKKVKLSFGDDEEG